MTIIYLFFIVVIIYKIQQILFFSIINVMATLKFFSDAFIEYTFI